MFYAFYFGLLACLLLIALFAASEAALAATNRVRLRHLLRMQAPDDHPAAQLLSSDLSNDAQRFIATVTVASNIPLLVAAVSVIWMAWRRHGLSPEAAFLSTAVALVVVSLFQITPRLIVSQPGALERLWWVRPARAIVAMLYPPVGLLLFIGRLILRPLGLVEAPRAGAADAGQDQESQNDEDEELHAEEIRDLVETAEASGLLGDKGKELIESIFTFGDTRVHEVMIPRPDIIGLPVECTPERILTTFQESGLSRLPLHEENIDHIVGILHVKDVLRCLSRNEWEFAPRDIMRAPLYLPESKKIDEALSIMRTQRTHLAIVIDEFGGTAGLLTVEDVLEELVGDIADEHDQQADAPFVVLDENTAVVDALFHTDDLEEQWGLTLPTGEFDTVGGFVIEQLGRAPAVGDRVELPEAVLVVQKVRGRRPKQIIIMRTPREDDRDSDGRPAPRTANQ
jgi:magnesium and cobalt transporter